MSAPATSRPAVNELVLALVRTGRRSVAEQGGELLDEILRRVAGPPAWDPGLVAATAAAAEAHVRALGELLDPTVEVPSITAPPLVLSQARVLARTGLPITTLLDGYHAGHDWWWRFAIASLAAGTDDASVLAAAMERVREVTFPYLREVTRQAIRAYTAEARELTRSGEAARRAALASLLGAGPVDGASVATRLGIDLEQDHVVLIAWPRRPAGGDDLVPALEGLLLRVAQGIGVVRPVLGTIGLGSVVAIVSRRRGGGGGGDGDGGECDLGGRMAALATGVAGGGLRVAAGGEGHGLEGLRGSFHEAQAAREFADLDADGPVAVTYSHVELASLLSADPARSRVFVARQLGGLAARDAGTRRLRDTVEQYLELGSNATRTAEQLRVHKNTVTYRLRQAEQERGRPLPDHPLELACALQLARVLPELLDAT